MAMNPLQLALHYAVDDLPGADVPCTRLQNVLSACWAAKALSKSSEEFLRSRGLLALIALAKGEIDESAFKHCAVAEQHLRRMEADKERLLQVRQAEIEAAQRDVMVAAMWTSHEAARRRNERDPRNLAKRRNRELRERFGVYDYVDHDAYPQLMGILKCLESSQRLPETSVSWLAVDGREYRTHEIMLAYHRLEADHFLHEFQATGNVWSAVSASSHLRKCDGSEEAHDLLSKIPEARFRQAKLKSAVQTTHGGALRDLRRHEEAKRLAEEAHSLVESDYRPCTLLGAIHIELGQSAEGHAWYKKAEARGAPPEHVDRELRAVLGRLPDSKRTSIIQELVASEAGRYEWLCTAFRS